MKVRTRQCKACPWKKSTRPTRDIPGGYCATKHARLESTIAEEHNFSALVSGTLRLMACHESQTGADYPCVGWLVHQLGPGNNMALRFLARDGRFRDLKTVGPQHETFEDTLPRKEDL
jgi:hypothetical protein